MRLSLFLFFFGSTMVAQDTLAYQKKTDLNYREDQFYVGITYNTFLNKPSGLTQKTFSPGINVGFLRDMPINKQRTFAVATGLGFSYQAYSQNLLVTESNGDYSYSIIESDISFRKNRFTTLNADLPIEFRWRTSTPDSHKFFRLYTGFKISYLLYDESRFISDQGNLIVKNNPELSSVQYGIYIATGYNTWNFYAYYGFNSLYSNVKIGNNSLDVSLIHLGLQFYIL
jgi:hypothetical protein